MNGKSSQPTAYPPQPTHAHELLTARIQDTAAKLAHRQMLLPALLFLVSHRPIAFVAGQGLFLLQPLEILLNGTGWHDWAALLSHPRGPAALEAFLLATLDGTTPPIASRSNTTPDS